MANLNSLVSRVSDDFAYVVCYCPDFPEEDQESLESAFGRLTTGEMEILAASGDRDSAHWLGLSLRDLKAAFEAYRLGDNPGGERLLQSARVFFEDFVQARPVFDNAKFIVDEKGEVSSEG